jgi:flagella basal body P-ring formation protein FlgA
MMKHTKFILKSCSRAFRLFILLLTVGTILPFVHPGYANSAIGLKRNSVVEGHTITLGDVFYGVPADKADRVLGAAPQPGRDMVLNARTLMRIALALDLSWRPVSGADYAVIRRAATIIEQEQIELALQEALAQDITAGRYKLALSPGQTAQMTLPASSPASVEIKDFNPDMARGLFEATLVAPSKEAPLQEIRVSGTLRPVITVPVLKDTLRNGDVIGRNDIKMLEVYERSLNHDIVLDAESLVGMTPRRMLFPGQPVKDGDIEAPRIVKRGESVTMIFKSGGLNLTAKGKALENGAKGDVVRVVNTASSRNIEAIVTAPGEVSVDNL